MVELLANLRRNKETLLHCSVFIELRSQTPVQEHSTEDDVEENIAADYAPKMDL